MQMALFFFLANIQEALQTYLDTLNNFCTSWKLHINTDKSKVVVFNSDANQYLDTYKCANSTLKTSSSYCYLGWLVDWRPTNS